MSFLARSRRTCRTSARYARALTGDQPSATPTCASHSRRSRPASARWTRARAPRVALYHVFHAIWGSTGAQLEGRGDDAPPVERDGPSARLLRIAPRSRQAFLLTALEGFTPSEAAQILDTDFAEVERLIATAQSEIDAELATDVLIIEDEPVIATDIEALARELGHKVVGIAATHAEAIEAAARRRPGLVLADIQLADGSSGVEAVREILSRFDLPVIFITAFPERLPDRREAGADLPDHQALPAGDGEGGDRPSAVLPPGARQAGRVASVSPSPQRGTAYRRAFRSASGAPDLRVACAWDRRRANLRIWHARCAAEKSRLPMEPARGNGRCQPCGGGDAPPT